MATARPAAAARTTSRIPVAVLRRAAGQRRRAESHRGRRFRGHRVHRGRAGSVGYQGEAGAAVHRRRRTGILVCAGCVPCCTDGVSRPYIARRARGAANCRVRMIQCRRPRQEVARCPRRCLPRIPTWARRTPARTTRPVAGGCRAARTQADLFDDHHRPGGPSGATTNSSTPPAGSVPNLAVAGRGSVNGAWPAWTGCAPTFAASSTTTASPCPVDDRAKPTVTARHPASGTWTRYR